MTKAKKLYSQLHEEFCKGSPKSKVNTKCKTEKDLLAYAMELYADRKVKKLNKSDFMRSAFFAGCESRNEEYQTISYEDAYEEWRKKHFA